MQIINTTDADLSVGGRLIPKSKTPAWVFVQLETDEHMTHTLMVDVVHIRSAEVRNLPDPKEDTIFLVTRQVLDELYGERPDCYVALVDGRLLGSKGA